MRRSLVIAASTLITAGLGAGIGVAHGAGVGVCWSEAPKPGLAAEGCVLDRKVTQQDGITTENRVVAQSQLGIDGDALGAPVPIGDAGANETVRQDESRFPGSVYRQSGLALSHWYASSGPLQYASATASLWQTTHTANASRRTYASAGTTVIAEPGASGVGASAEQSRSSGVPCRQRAGAHAGVADTWKSQDVDLGPCPVELGDVPDIPVP